MNGKYANRISETVERLRLFSVLFFLLLWAGEAAVTQTVERVRLISADRMESATEGGAAVRKLIGNVRLAQGEAFMDCEEAVLFEAEDRSRLLRNVKIFDGKRTLQADEVDYDGKRKVEHASGHAVVKSGGKTVSADEIEYRQETEQVFARGRVAVRDTIERLLLESDEAFYDRKKDYTKVFGNPHAVKFDTSTAKKDWHISGMTMETWGKEKRFLITDSASIEQADMKATGRIAEYWSGKNLLILRLSPNVLQLNREITGDSIAIELRNMRFQGGRVFGKARILSTDSTGQDELKGARITIEARGDTLDRVIVEEQAESSVRLQEKDRTEQGRNTATGDRIVLEFEGDKLKQMKVTSRPGSSTGKYTPARENGK
jgi:lipopolysaccharide export system protein LptA